MQGLPPLLLLRSQGLPRRHHPGSPRLPRVAVPESVGGRIRIVSSADRGDGAAYPGGRGYEASSSGGKALNRHIVFSVRTP